MNKKNTKTSGDYEMTTERSQEDVARHDRLRRKSEFVDALAEFLVSNQATKSIKLQMQDPLAIEWAKLRSKSTLHGYPTLEEAKASLREFLLT
jgi:hypothetical protein